MTSLYVTNERRPIPLSACYQLAGEGFCVSVFLLQVFDENRVCCFIGLTEHSCNMPRKKYWRKTRFHKETKGDGNVSKNNDSGESGTVVFTEISTVSGHFHQGHPQFMPNSGAQCVANSCSAILYDKVKPVSMWTSNDLDAVLISGDELYSNVKPNLPAGETFLLISDIPDVMDMHNGTFGIRAGESLTGYVLGTVHADLQSDIFMPLRDALERTLSVFTSCLITFHSSTFAIIKRDQYLYVVDSHSRNVEGVQVVDGTAVSIRYTGLEGVFQHCTRLAISLNTGALVLEILVTVGTGACGRKKTSDNCNCNFL
ncbi:uncharacterized protein LOC135471304 [Liolophura sinensis]|uniref:uncharacterized protein LOC135471304 n=1 Tax=Liolophura sinensis TaxID=3198878 RepID=UPI003158D944